MPLQWQQAVEHVQPLVVRISTPHGSGTGFLVSHSTTSPVCGIATAAHVIDQAHYWEQPVRIHHYQSGKSILLRHHERAIILEEKLDTAAIVMDKEDLPLPVHPPEITPEGRHLKIGVEVGWLGFPAISPQDLCFFSGRTSSFLQKEHAYLIDGVAINGVSGGPTFILAQDKPMVIGVLSAYIANRVTGESLPGLSVVRDVTQFQTLIKKFKSIDDAKKGETPPQPPPPQPGPTGKGSGTSLKI